MSHSPETFSKKEKDPPKKGEEKKSAGGKPRCVSPSAGDVSSVNPLPETLSWQVESNLSCNPPLLDVQLDAGTTAGNQMLRNTTRKYRCASVSPFQGPASVDQDLRTYQCLLLTSQEKPATTRICPPECECGIKEEPRTSEPGYREIRLVFIYRTLSSVMNAMQ